MTHIADMLRYDSFLGLLKILGRGYLGLGLET